jgi:hypothetical protein
MESDPLAAHGPKPKSANASPLMKAQARAKAGTVVNACPFGCDVGDLDEHGYCRHLVGFTPPGRKDVFEFMPPAEAGTGILRRAVDGNDVRQVRGSDKLVRITTSHRVYRDVDAERERQQAQKDRDEARRLKEEADRVKRETEEAKKRAGGGT